jgi:hypothetical protein
LEAYANMEGNITTYRKGFAPVIIAVAVAAIVLVVATGLALGLTLSEIRKRTGETPIASSGSGVCGGVTAPATTLTLGSFSIPNGGAGKISSEDHLVTKEDPTRAPTENLPPNKQGAKRSNQGINDHLRVTNFSSNCPSSSGYCNPSNQEWTPEEGGGEIGEGNKVGLGNIPAAHEPWIMNARWPKPYPDPGTIVIITAKKTGKSITAVAGYELGPSESTGHNAGAQKEVLANLGIVHGDEVTFGFAIDQSLAPGTIYGADCTGSSQYSDCGNVPLFRQCGNPWGDDPYGFSRKGPATICSSGCGPTSLAMVLKYNGVNITPAETAKYSLDNKLRVNGEGTKAELFQAMANKYNLKFEALDWDSAKEVLSQKKPLIVGVRGEPFSSGGHYIVLTCLNNNTVSINDPGPRKLTSSTVTEVQQGVARGGQGAYYYIHP